MHSVTRVSLGLNTLLSALGLFHLFHKPAQSLSHKVKVEKVSASEIKSESYSFDRHIKAVLSDHAHGDRNFADIRYRGIFKIDRLDAERARITFTLDHQASAAIPFEVTIHEWTLTELKSGATKNEQDEESLNILKDFAALYAFRSQEDTSGKYDARFSKQGYIIIKEKIRYKSTLAAAVQILKSKHQIQLDSTQHTLIKAMGKETSIVRASKSSVMKTTSEYQITHLGAARPRLISTAPVVENSLISTTMALQASHSDQFIPWKTLEPKLNQIATLSAMDRLSLFHDLVNTTKKDATAFQELKGWLSSQSSNMEVRTFAIGVLVTMGSEAAQHALLDWYQQFPESRPTILNAFITTAAPISDEVHSFLTDLLDQKTSDPDPASAAALALGAALQNSNRSSDISKLQNLYQNAQNSSEQTVYLDAMGNSGNPEFLDTIKDGLAANDEMVRENAVLALRLMKDQLTHDLVEQAWTDSSLKVKSATLQVIQYQGSAGNYQALLAQCISQTPELKSTCGQLL